MLSIEKQSQITISFSGNFQEWPEEDYPPYANGPGYIVSYDIAEFVVSEFEKQKLRVCAFVYILELSKGVLF